MGVSQPNRLRTLVESPAFNWFIVGVIVVNAAVLGLQTYAEVEEKYGSALDVANDVCFAIFLGELALRIASYGRRPQDFFRSGWNVFDFVVITAVFIPGVRQNATVLRVVRLLRVVRVVRLLPEVRVLLTGVWRSVPPLASMAVLTVLLLFIYGMVGWLLFGDEIPADWGDIGQAMLTLFVMLTLENFPAYMDRGMEVHPWSWIYFVSFVLIAAFVVLNVLIGIVLNSMEEAREIERRRMVAERLPTAVPGGSSPAHAPVVERIAILRAALDELEAELAAPRSAPPEPATGTEPT
jgi:voltage-gated sodium channel